MEQKGGCEMKNTIVAIISNNAENKIVFSTIGKNITANEIMVMEFTNRSSLLCFLKIMGDCKKDIKKSFSLNNYEFGNREIIDPYYKEFYVGQFLKKCEVYN